MFLFWLVVEITWDIWYSGGMLVICPECGTEFNSGGSRGPVKRFCSDRCRKREYRRRVQIPAIMRDSGRWVRADGKRPIMPSGLPASSTNPATWSQWGDVKSGAGDGFGFMLGGGFGCLDLDSCFEKDGLMKSWAMEAVEALEYRVIFCERSVSGNGVHVFVECPELPGVKRKLQDGGGVEFYSHSRFIRMTADIVGVSA